MFSSGLLTSPISSTNHSCVLHTKGNLSTALLRGVRWGGLRAALHTVAISAVGRQVHTHVLPFQERGASREVLVERAESAARGSRETVHTVESAPSIREGRGPVRVLSGSRHGVGHHAARVLRARRVQMSDYLIGAASGIPPCFPGGLR